MKTSSGIHSSFLKKICVHAKSGFDKEWLESLWLVHDKRGRSSEVHFSYYRLLLYLRESEKKLSHDGIIIIAESIEMVT